jgi:hypothetical protein
MNTEITSNEPAETVGCVAVGCREINVSVPITVKAFGEAGNAVTRCMGEPVVATGYSSDSNGKKEACNFTISQRLQIEIPVIFGARAEAGEASVDCECCECGSDGGDKSE